MPESSPSFEVPLHEKRRIDTVCDDFEARWKSGQRPRIEEILAGWHEPARSLLLCSLLAVELEWRREGLREQATEEEYRPRFPGHGKVLAELFQREAAALLPPGTRLGLYEIVGLLGEGGMGRVYRARDTRLGRAVALKVLQPRFARDPEWLARFQREARLLASLRHPAIATLYHLDEAEGVRFLAMELVEGPTLAERLGQGRLPLDQTLDVCRQIAAALEYAHGQGVVHRDLKPANIKITPERQVKVLDFGLAKAVRALAPADPSQETGEYLAPTSPGLIVGTLAYVSPEQAGGERPDGPGDEWTFGKRGDVWAFGCVFYECLAGRPAFTGKTGSAILAAVLKDSPDWQALPDLPRRVEGLLRRCLQKDPQRRQRDLGDVRIEIEEILTEHQESPPAPKRRRVPLALAGLLFALGIAAGLGIGTGWRTAPPDWSGQLLLGGTTRAFGPRVAPNRQWLAFSVLEDGQAQPGVLTLDTESWRVRSHDQMKGGLLSGVCWSADSRRVFFDRFFDVPRGIYSVGPEEVKGRDNEAVEVLKDAECPQVVSDGSLVVCKLDEDGNYRLYRHRQPYLPAEAEQLTPQPLDFNRAWPKPVRALRKSEQVVFCARILDGSASPRTRFYRLDLRAEGDPQVRPLFSRDLPLGEGRFEMPIPLAVDPEDRFLYTILPAGDLFQLVRLSLRKEDAAPEPLFPLTLPTFGMDVDGENAVYLDQFQRTLEVLRFDETGGEVNRVASSPRGREMPPVELPSGRVLLPGLASGSSRIIAGLEGKESVPLLEGELETVPPAVLLFDGRLALVTGSGKEWQLSIAELKGDRAQIQKTVKGVPAEGLQGLAASKDSQWIYYVHAKQVWKVPEDSRLPPEKVADGDGVTVDPETGVPLIQKFERTGVHFYWVRPGGKLEEVPVQQGELRLAPHPVFGRAINRRGQALVTVAQAGYWFWRTAVLDLRSGKLELIRMAFEGDVFPATWSVTDDTKVVAMAYSYRSELWRFKPAKQ